MSNHLYWFLGGLLAIVGLYIVYQYILPWLIFLFLLALPVAALLAIVGVTVYNSLISFMNAVTEMESNIDIELERKHSLISQLMDQVKQYSNHESETLCSVIDSRSRSQSATNKGDQAVAEAELNVALSNLYALAESYPDLKANENFLRLQTDITDTENRISQARLYYNNAVREFNDRVGHFPNNLLAGLFGFSQQAFFTLQKK